MEVVWYFKHSFTASLSFSLSLSFWTLFLFFSRFALLCLPRHRLTTDIKLFTAQQGVARTIILPFGSSRTHLRLLRRQNKAKTYLSLTYCPTLHGDCQSGLPSKRPGVPGGSIEVVLWQSQTGRVWEFHVGVPKGPVRGPPWKSHRMGRAKAPHTGSGTVCVGYIPSTQGPVDDGS